MPEQDFGANARGTDPNPNSADGIVAANPQRYLTYGEKAVGLTFNPSGDPLVYDVKLAIAKHPRQPALLHRRPRKEASLLRCHHRTARRPDVGRQSHHVGLATFKNITT